ncbi:MAG: YihY family inner membrane protein, partial [Sedimentisphaerales bacterium]|nr:YihY family inner membrane protein [Sedimentisphaerales bacterium]
MLSKVIRFITTDIWRIHLKNYSPTKSFFIRQLRIIVLAVRGYGEDKCKFRASALTFFSLLSIVPVLAMMFGIAKGFGLEKRVEQQLFKRMEGQEEVMAKIIDFSNSLLENVKGGFIAGVGVVFLFWIIIELLSNIESSFNEIWGVKTGRSFGRKFSDYLSVMLVCPILLVLSGSITVAISSHIRLIIEKIPMFSSIGPFVFFLLKLLPYCTIWFIFTFIFIFMPNTKVRLRSGLLAGIVAGTIFQIVQWIYINFQIGAARYGAIYGSFAALPLFLIWLQVSWLVVFFGAELSFAHQNVDTYEFEQDCLGASYSFKRLISLLLARTLVQDFCEGRKASNASELAQRLEIPIRLVREVLYELSEASVLSKSVGVDDKDPSFQPGRNVEKLTIK